MKAYQVKVIEERRELNEKLDKLVEFLKASDELVQPAERDRLLRQRDVMQQYSDILARRIAHFEL